VAFADSGLTGYRFVQIRVLSGFGLLVEPRNADLGLIASSKSRLSLWCVVPDNFIVGGVICWDRTQIVPHHQACWASTSHERLISGMVPGGRGKGQQAIDT